MHTRFLSLFILSLFCCLHNALTGNPDYTVEYASPESCRRLEKNSVQYYFNTTTLGCLPCAQNATFQTVSSDGLFPNAIYLFIQTYSTLA